MVIIYENIILACWAAFLIVWVASAFNVKRDIVTGKNIWRHLWLLRLVSIGLLLLVAIRLATGKAHYINPGLVIARNIFPQSPVLGWTAAVISVVGVCFAIWARAHLGRNWSPRPAIKEHHELVTTVLMLMFDTQFIRE